MDQTATAKIFNRIFLLFDGFHLTNSDKAQIKANRCPS